MQLMGSRTGRGRRQRGLPNKIPVPMPSGSVAKDVGKQCEREVPTCAAAASATISGPPNQAIPLRPRNSRDLTPAPFPVPHNEHQGLPRSSTRPLSIVLALKTSDKRCAGVRIELLPNSSLSRRPCFRIRIAGSDALFTYPCCRQLLLPTPGAVQSGQYHRHRQGPKTISALGRICGRAAHAGMRQFPVPIAVRITGSTIDTFESTRQADRQAWPILPKRCTVATGKHRNP